MSFDILIQKPEFVLRTVTEVSDEIIMKYRYSDGMITVVDGILIFDFVDTEIMCCNGESIYVPKGSNYRIKCLQRAQSRIVNFYTDGSVSTPIAFSRMDKTVYEKYSIGLRSCSKAKMRTEI